jgi:hypothetical protein
MLPNSRALLVSGQFAVAFILGWQMVFSVAVMSITLNLNPAIPVLGTYFLVSLFHGSCVVAAWVLGWRSVLLFAPAATVLVVLRYTSDTGSVSESEVLYVALILAHLVSAPASFTLLAWCGAGTASGTDADMNRSFWRVIVLAGFLG